LLPLVELDDCKHCTSPTRSPCPQNSASSNFVSLSAVPDTVSHL